MTASNFRAAGTASPKPSQVQQDYNVLNYKKRHDKPRLCAGDGPIMRYRVYAERFYRPPNNDLIHFENQR